MYIDKDRKASADILKQVEGLGAKAIVFTIDVGWESKRTLEARTNAKIPDSALGAFMASGGLQDRKLSWEDISWFRVSVFCDLKTELTIYMLRSRAEPSFSNTQASQSLSRACKALRTSSSVSSMALMGS